MSLGDLKETCQMGRLACQSDSNLTFPGFRCVEEIKNLFQILGKIQGKGLSPPTLTLIMRLSRARGWVGVCLRGEGGGRRRGAWIWISMQFPWAVT